MSGNSSRKLLPKPPNFKEPPRKSPPRRPPPPPPPPPEKEGGDNDNKSKRISTACVPCRNRKSKCDGNNPCTACVVHQSQCQFDYLSDRRRRIHVTGDAELLHSRRDKLIKIIDAVRIRSDEEFDVIKDMIMQGLPLSDVTSYVEDLQMPPTGATGSLDKVGGATAESSHSFSTQSSDKGMSMGETGSAAPSSSTTKGTSNSPGRGLIGALHAFPVWQHSFGPDSLNLPACSQPDPPDELIVAIAQSLSSWTSALNDPRSISHLFSLYTSVWGVSLYFFIDFDLFLRDMVPCVISGKLTGSDLFFGGDLANALLAVSCVSECAHEEEKGQKQKSSFHSPLHSFHLSKRFSD